MDIGLLNEKVTFQKNTVITDSIGNHKNGWEDFYTCQVGGKICHLTYEENYKWFMERK